MLLLLLLLLSCFLVHLRRWLMQIKPVIFVNLMSVDLSHDRLLYHILQAAGTGLWIIAVVSLVSTLWIHTFLVVDSVYFIDQGITAIRL